MQDSLLPRLERSDSQLHRLRLSSSSCVGVWRRKVSPSRRSITTVPSNSSCMRSRSLSLPCPRACPLPSPSPWPTRWRRWWRITTLWGILLRAKRWEAQQPSALIKQVRGIQWSCWPTYRLGYPEYHLFLAMQTKVVGSKYPSQISFGVENTIVNGNTFVVTVKLSR